MRTRFVALTFAASVLAMVAAGCGGGGKKAPAGSGTGSAKQPAKMEMQVAEPSQATKDVLAEIAGYEGWPKFPENQAAKQSAGHMNMFVLAFYNDVVQGAIDGKQLPLPDGSLIVKQNMAMAQDGAPMALTIMAKKNGKWHWSETNMDGKVVVMDGKALEGEDVPMCVNCHKAQADDNDLVVTHSFK